MTRRWIYEPDSERVLCPFGEKLDFKNNSEDSKTSKCQGEFCMAWGWYSDFRPDDANDKKANLGTCLLIPPMED